MAQKMWAQYFKMKMNKEMKRSHTVEDAFQRIRSTTAIHDVSEMVHKYLTREQTYASLLQAVGQHERRLEELRKKTDDKREVLAKLQIEHTAVVRKKPSKASTKGDPVETEILSLGDEIEYLEKELETLTERRKKINLVSDQVGGWANKVVSKLNNQLLGQAALKSGQRHSLTSLFDQITDIVSDSVEDIIAGHSKGLVDDMS